MNYLTKLLRTLEVTDFVKQQLALKCDRRNALAKMIEHMACYGE